MSRGLFVSLYKKGKPFTLIDCRERRDFVNGHWFGSINIPLSRLTENSTKLLPDNGFPIHFLDWQDKPSKESLRKLNFLGYRNILPEKTDYPDKIGDGFVKGEYVWSKAFGEVIGDNSNIPEITPSMFISDYKDAQLFDVRPNDEYQKFTLPGSINLPNSQLLASYGALSKSKKMVLLHCAGRTRSIIGANTLKASGYKGKLAIFRGGTQAWQLAGYQRELQAGKSFSKKTESSYVVEEFLNKWKIPYEKSSSIDIREFQRSNRGNLIFDVSDDNADCQIVDQGLLKVSGTTLIQQTDQSIGCFHMPIVLFDLGSGSRAAFSAYWLKLMGFQVRVIILEEAPIIPRSQKPFSETLDENCPAKILDLCQLYQSEVQFDFRPSQEFEKRHLKGSRWKNLSKILSERPFIKKIGIVAESKISGSEICGTLTRLGWNIFGYYCWNETEINKIDLSQCKLNQPIDRSSLFEGRHNGNLKDAQNYLDWEEKLPESIDPFIHDMWVTYFNRKPKEH